MSSSIGSSLKYNSPSTLTKAHILADALLTFVARVSMENADVLTELVDLIEEAANGEEERDEMLTCNLLRGIIPHIELIRDEPPTGYEEPNHRYCVDYGLRPCRNGMSHTLQRT